MSFIYCVVSYWGVPIFGGGEQFLYDTMYWAQTVLGMRSVWICFADANPSRGEYSRTEITESKTHGIIIKMGKGFSVENLNKILSKIRPSVVHHQGHKRKEIMEECSKLNIPFFTGFHFWNDAVDLYQQKNKNILGSSEHKISPLYKNISENATTYSCSEFVNEVIKRVGGIPPKYMLYPVSPESRVKSQTPYNFKDNIYVTMINIHLLKGGEFLLNCIKQNPYIPFMCVRTEYYSNELDTEIRQALKKNSQNMYLTRTDDISAIYSKTRILLVMSEVDETFCKVAQEGLCNGIPIVTTFAGYLAVMLDNVGVNIKPEDLSSLYNDEEKLTKMSSHSLSRYHAKYNEKIGISQFKTIVSDCVRQKISIGMYVPWGDQGLGIQARNYSMFFKELGYKISVFSFRPYFVGNGKTSRELQSNPREWDIEGVNVYYGTSDRETTSCEEISTFLKSNDVTHFLIPETCFYKVFRVAEHIRNLNIRVFAIPNIETIRRNEINLHRIFDCILCNNKDTEIKLRNLGFTAVQYLGYSIYPTKLIAKKYRNYIPSSRIKFLCICGLNSVVRKNAIGVLEAFYKAISDDNNIELTLTIQGSQIPETISNFTGPNIHIKIEHINHEQIMELYHEHDVVIHASKHEGLGIGFFESICTGTPVVTLDTPPHNEIIIPGTNGWLCRCSDEDMKDNSQGIVKSAIFDPNDLCHSIRTAASTMRLKGNEIVDKTYEDYQKRYGKNVFINTWKKIFEGSV